MNELRLGEGDSTQIALDVIGGEERMLHRGVEHRAPARVQGLVPDDDANRSCAHALARVCLGVNICLHGLTRMPHFAAFAAKLQKEFAETFLPAALVHGTAYVIVIGEAVIGFCVLIGLSLRGALIAGTCLMILLQFGTALVQDWNAAGLQLPYVAFYVVLLATVRYDRYSVDAWRARARR